MITTITTAQSLLNIVINSNIQPSIILVKAGDPFALSAVEKRKLRKISTYQDAIEVFNNSLELAVKVFNAFGKDITPETYNHYLQTLVNQYSLVKKYAPTSLKVAA